ncbi:MAG: regulatory protein [Caudoviricetes sp.]|nr:MAG: regulatory protein [Caudoviricetes sp.]
MIKKGGNRMNELKVFNFNQVDVVDSREVAKLVEKRHNDLLRDIRGYIEIMEKSGERKIAHSDFFIKSSYKSEQNKEMPCYLLTKKGCDMVANKMTGEKGVLFTAAYVTAFEKMREKMAFEVPKDYPSALRALADAEEKRLALVAENESQRQAIADFQPIKQYVDTILSSTRTMTTTQIAADYDMTARQLNQILHDEGIQHKVNGQWILYKKHMGKGYTKSKTISITRSDGRPDTVLHTEWTQKGRMLIHEILTRRGILAAMDKVA